MVPFKLSLDELRARLVIFSCATLISHQRPFEGQSHATTLLHAVQEHTAPDLGSCGDKGVGRESERAICPSKSIWLSAAISCTIRQPPLRQQIEVLDAGNVVKQTRPCARDVLSFAGAMDIGNIFGALTIRIPLASLQLLQINRNLTMATVLPTALPSLKVNISHKCSYAFRARVRPSRRTDNATCTARAISRRDHLVAIGESLIRGSLVVLPS